MNYVEIKKQVEQAFIDIISQADCTPKGKRTARIVRHKINGRKCAQVIRCYVGRKAYMEKTIAEFELVNEWLRGGK